MGNTTAPTFDGEGLSSGVIQDQVRCWPEQGHRWQTDRAAHGYIRA